MAERKDEGLAHWFVYNEGRYMIALPFLLRSLAGVPGLEDAGEGWNDVTSVDENCVRRMSVDPHVVTKHRSGAILAR